MAKKTIVAKKTSKKFLMKRSEIRDALAEVRAKLDEVDTFESSPIDVSSLLRELVADLEALESDIDDEV